MSDPAPISAKTCVIWSPDGIARFGGLQPSRSWLFLWCYRCSGTSEVGYLLSSTGILGTTCFYSVNTNFSPSSKFNNSSCTRAIDPCRVTVYYHSGTGGKPRLAHSRLHLSLNAPQHQNAVHVSRHAHWLAERGSWTLYIAEGQDAALAAYHFAICADRRRSPGLSRVSFWPEKLLIMLPWPLQPPNGLGPCSDIGLRGKLGFTTDVILRCVLAEYDW